MSHTQFGHADGLPIAGFRVSGFRTLRDIHIRCSGPITIICGPNNTGKSSLLVALRAYERLAEAIKSQKRPPWNLSEPLDEVSVALSLPIDLRTNQLHGPLTDVAGKEQQDAVNEMLRQLADELDDPYLWLDLIAEAKRVSPDVDHLTPLQETLNRWRKTNEYRRWLTWLGKLGPLQNNSQLTEAWVAGVLTKALRTPRIRHIPDVRRAANQPLSDSDLSSLVVAAGHTTRDPAQKRQAWARTLEHILQDVFGPTVRYEANPAAESPGELRLAIDGQADILVDHVGAGVREVIAIAFEALGRGGADVLCIEEPENCLHPTAVRRLLHSLAHRANLQLFVTTHSAAVINSASDTVIEMTRHEAASEAHAVTDAGARFRAVQALGHSPADLVLTPCAVWVEGPSDRLYLAQWLANEDLYEGLDYQVVFFAGALGTHLSAAHDPNEESLLSQVRPLSRRCVFVVDTDRNRSRGALKAHVKRWRQEVANDNDARVLLTWGREIENSLPLETINEIRRRKQKNPITESHARFGRIIDQPLSKKISKLEFARQALDLTDGVTPENALTLVRKLGQFIRQSPGIS